MVFIQHVFDPRHDRGGFAGADQARGAAHGEWCIEHGVDVVCEKLFQVIATELNFNRVRRIGRLKSFEQPYASQGEAGRELRNFSAAKDEFSAATSDVEDQQSLTVET